MQDAISSGSDDQSFLIAVKSDFVTENKKYYKELVEKISETLFEADHKTKERQWAVPVLNNGFCDSIQDIFAWQEFDKL